MGYIFFNIQNIKESCKRDIDLYITALLNSEGGAGVILDAQPQHLIQSKLETYGLAGIDVFYSVEEPLVSVEDPPVYLSQIESILKQMGVQGITYLDKFHTVDESGKEKLWILRTLLLYNILIIATMFMIKKADKKLLKYILGKYTNVNEIYKQDGVKCFTPNILKTIEESQNTNNFTTSLLVSMFPDLDSVIGLNQRFKLGNFGSYKTTSDIDLGLILKGSYSDGEKSHMADVIWLVEGLFIVLTGWDTLQYDIELYGDMLTIEQNDKETFYLDTSYFVDINPLLPSVYYSVARNQLMAPLLSDLPSANDLPLPQLGIKHILDSRKTDQKLLQLLELDKPDPEADPDPKMLEMKNHLSGKVSVSYQEVLHVVASGTNDAIYESIQQDMKGYLLASRVDFGSKNVKYAQTPHGRYLYYAALLRAETARISFIKMSTHSQEETIGIIILIARALGYRMEDYTSICTVEHVVRTIQAKKDTTNTFAKREQQIIHNITDCKEAQPSVAFQYALCMLGEVGLTLSIIEQIGFMHRFFNDYCQDPQNDKCLSKLLKYQDRIIHAVKLIDELRNNKKDKPVPVVVESVPVVESTPFRGGKRIKKYKSKKMKMKTNKSKKMKMKTNKSKKMKTNKSKKMKMKKMKKPKTKKTK